MPRIPKNKIPVSISVSLDLLTEIDDYAYYENKTRSEFIIEAVKEKITRMQEKK